MSETASYSLRLPRAIKAAAQKTARSEGISMNQFVVCAVTEKLAALKAAEYFSERKSRADLAHFQRLLGRKSGAVPREGDEGPYLAHR